MEQLIELRLAHCTCKRNIDAKLVNNTLILVGENGSGKTTFLRILFHFLSGRWFSLLQFKFDYIVATISGVEFKVTYETLTKGFEKVDRRFLMDMPPIIRQKFMDFFASNATNEIPEELERWSRRQGIPLDMIVRQLELFGDNPKGPKKELQEMLQKIRAVVGAQILYLPTYRRIERELGSIFEGMDVDEMRRGRGRGRLPEPENADIELVEFGMKDVDLAIKRTLESLKEFARENLNNLTLRYLGDVVNQEYRDVGMKEIAEVQKALSVVVFCAVRD